jgi:hypothetical protein
MGAVLTELGDQALRMRREEVPYLGEFFAIFNNSDEYFRSRRTWSIYEP